MPCRRIPRLCTISVAVLGATLHLATPTGGNRGARQVGEHEVGEQARRIGLN